MTLIIFYRIFFKKSTILYKTFPTLSHVFWIFTGETHKKQQLFGMISALSLAGFMPGSGAWDDMAVGNSA